MKIFISQKILDLTSEEILKKRQSAVKYVEENYTEASILETYQPNLYSKELKNKEVKYLAFSVNILASADLLLVVGDISGDRISEFESAIAEEFGIEVRYLKDEDLPQEPVTHEED